MKKTPQQKKDLQYKKDRRTGSLHGYVKSYPVTKARINRASRHEMNALLKKVEMETLARAETVTDEQAITRERLQHSIKRPQGADFKAQPHPLKEWVKNHLESRVHLAGDRYFAREYNSESHRQEFRKYLQTLVSGRSLKSATVARFYKEVLNPPNPESERYHARRSVWLKAFFMDHPEDEAKLHAWIEKMEDQHSRDTLHDVAIEQRSG